MGTYSKFTEKIMLGKVLAFVFVLICTVFTAEDDFFCKMKKDNWQVCRKCNDTNLTCDGVSLDNECKCDGIQIAQKDSYELYGGKEHCKKEGWCFVKFTKEKVCSDQEWTSDNERFTTDPITPGTPYIWLKNKTEFAKSWKACESEEQHNIGNEEMLQDIRITTDFLQFGTIDNNGIEQLEGNLTFDAESTEECRQECESRQQCGAWSYDSEMFLCHLHTVDGCCGQFDKREPAIGFTSGYICKSCWSTRGECPCSAEERLPKDGTAQSGPQTTGTGAKVPKHVTSTGEVFISLTEDGGEDLCKCVYRSFPKRLLPRCGKPVCKHPENNPDGKCEDERRCRKTCRP